MQKRYLSILAIGMSLSLSGCNMTKNADGTYNLNEVGTDGGGACHGEKKDKTKSFCIPKVSEQACFTSYNRDGYNVWYTKGGGC